MLTLILTAALGQWAPEPPPGAQQYDPGSVCQRTGGRCFKNRSGNRPVANYAYFEFAPSNGAGMGTACACAAITGAKGETLTFTRTGNATCSKQGLATTGIANGDLVVCAGDQPRVESSGGVLGLRVEGSRTNSVQRSQEIDNAAWIPQNAGVAIPTITANAATAPDGTLTAERVVIADCPAGGNYSIVQSSGAVQTSATGTLFVRGNGTSGNLGLSLSSTGGPNGFASCAYVSGSWTRCVVSASGAAATTTLFFGCGNGVVNMTQTGAADVFVWGGSIENGAYATSYIPTVAAAVTRNIESPAFTLSSAVGPSASIAASAQWPSTAVGAVNYLALGNVGDNMTLYRTNDTGAGFQINATITAPAVSSMGTTVHRAALADASGTRSAFWDLGSVAAPAASMAAGVSTVWIGRNVGGTPADGIVTRVCIDPDPTRCR